MWHIHLQGGRGNQHEELVEHRFLSTETTLYRLDIHIAEHIGIPILHVHPCSCLCTHLRCSDVYVNQSRQETKTISAGLQWPQRCEESCGTNWTRPNTSTWKRPHFSFSKASNVRIPEGCGQNRSKCDLFERVTRVTRLRWWKASEL